MKSYIQKLNQLKNITFSSLETPVNRKIPIELQISSWWNELPEQIKKRPFQINEISMHCKGIYKDQPATRDIARALRNLGWEQIRIWKKSGRNKRLWIYKKSN